MLTIDKKYIFFIIFGVVCLLIVCIMYLNEKATQMTFEKQCLISITKSSQIKEKNGFSQLEGDGYNAVKMVCMPCYFYDLLNNYKDFSNLNISYFELLKNKLTTTDGGTIFLGNTSKKIDPKFFPNYYRCLTVEPHRREIF